VPWVHQLWKATIKRQGLSSWTIALGLFTASVTLRILFDPFLTGMKFLTFWPAIAVATFVCGWRQGAMVVLLSALTAWYFYIEPFNSFAVKDKATVGALVGFLVIAGFTVLMLAALRDAIRRLEIAKAVQETMFADLQHRVANNLQLVVALLRNAQRNLRNPVRAAELLSTAEDRIMAMALLHRRLNDGTAYDKGLEPLLREMIVNAFRDLPVTVLIDVRGASDLTIDQMTAMTLLVNEPALNAAKHVFSKGLGSRFEVSLTKDDDARLHLNIIDDGPGCEAHVLDAEATSLGMGIMEAFAAQLGGSLEVGGRDGTSLSVDFRSN
jgi:two-component system, sensor histidine kinase PdtaS